MTCSTALQVNKLSITPQTLSFHLCNRAWWVEKVVLIGKRMLLFFFTNTGLIRICIPFDLKCWRYIWNYDTPAYMFNVYKNQPSRQTWSRNVTGPKTLPTIWGTYRYMKLVTKYQISAINSCWEKYLGTDRRTEVKQYTPSGGV